MRLRTSACLLSCVGAAWIGLGCQSAPMMVTPCEVNSDCPEPLVCSDSGRCMVECTTQHECMQGLHCSLRDGAGQCFLDQPLDHTTSPCGDGRACPDPTQTCRDFTCWDHCTTHADCLPDSYCRRGVCANPSSPTTSYGIHVLCTSAADCLTGEICASDRGSNRVCRRPCTASTDCTDAEATPICAAIDDPAMPAGTMACVIGCNPIRQTGCYDRDRCEVEIAAAAGGGMATFFECMGHTGTVIQGVPCGTTSPMLGTCDASLGCAPAMADMTGGYECRQFCGDDADCHSAALVCTGAPIPGIQNIDIVHGLLHMCQPR